MTDTSKALLAHLNAVTVKGKTLPAYVKKYDADCQWLNADEVLIRRRWGIVQGCRYLLVLFPERHSEERETVEMCFSERADACNVAKMASDWGVDRAHVYWLNQALRQNAFVPSRWESEYGSESYCDDFDFARGEEWHGTAQFNPNEIHDSHPYFPNAEDDFNPRTVHGHLPRFNDFDL